jgi:hypothetical protein
MKRPTSGKITAAKIIAGLAATATIGAAVAGCVDPASNETPGVYGPPPDEPAVTTEEVTEEAVTEESYETEDNEVPAVYGPPEDMME